jgi:quercetin dioxygenase-like cupin family protein
MIKFFFTAATHMVILVSAAQVAVREEPRHHRVFENELIRILDVYLPPGDTTQYHLHNTPSVFITFTKTATGSQQIGQQPEKSISVAGQVWYDNLSTPRIHRVWNEDSIWFHVMDIELTAGFARSIPVILKNPSLHLHFNEPLAAGYRLKLPANDPVVLPKSVMGYLLLATGDGNIEVKSKKYNQKRRMKAGHYVWIEAGRPIRLINTGHEADFFLLQLK